MRIGPPVARSSSLPPGIKESFQGFVARIERNGKYKTQKIGKRFIYTWKHKEDLRIVLRAHNYDDNWWLELKIMFHRLPQLSMIEEIKADFGIIGAISFRPSVKPSEVNIVHRI